MDHIPLKERRDFVPYFAEKDRQTREANLSLVWVFIFVVTVAALFVHTFVEPIAVPTKAHAEQTGPMTNKEACQDLKEKGGFVKDHLKDIVTLCAKEGINL